ncbi:hypothetical protein NKR19_g8977 [Coniochaeta hoffmannii]|uniref:Uncharacterized protein n=1 Tax=Coniochaeta hoffmannii TaxID=91930 RepID=A0AA38VE41_9PEZI|nr:hypothetical protein NKR19_g8977 [Coniochaeta hoffmannii]
MPPLNSTTARLRRTFAYPTDDDSTTPSSTPDAAAALDEEEQERLIASLAAANDARNAQFRRLLFALPALASVPHLVSLLTFNRPQSALLALTSLAATGWLLYYLPPAETGIPLLDGLGGGRQGGGLGEEEEAEEDDGEDDEDSEAIGRQRRRSSRRRRASSFSVSRREIFHRTPLERWLPWLNLGLCGVLVVIGVLKSARDGRKDGLVMDLLPGVVYAVVLAAKVVMGGVDPEGELAGLRYEYKGA